MSSRPFVHLHCHSHYSLLDGASRLPELVQRVKTAGMNAVALTDHGNLYGAIEFYRECKTAGLNPIIGYEAYVAPGKRTDREPRRSSDDTDDATYHHLTLLAKNATGFRNLIKMASLAFLEGYHRKPRIDKELLEAHHEGLICLSGCAAAEFSDYILRGRLEEAEKLAVWFKRLFEDDFYIEVQNNGLEIQRLCAEGAIDIANRLGLPLVATSDAHYLRQEDSLAHDVLLCINTGKLRSNPKRFRFEGNQFFVRAPEEMYALFPGHEEAVKRSQEIADGVHIDLDFKKRHFPVFTPPAEKSPEDYLRELCAEGLRQRYGDNPPEAARKRLEHELGIICRMGFASYFLIVWDFVRFATENGIPASARGSGCGALVSYVLRLSHVDPLDYDLLFERFLDPNRAEAPDIDIDFCQERREQVIAYVKQKYGEMSVAQIATFGTLAARAAIKDVGRVLDVPLERVNQLTKMVPTTLHITLDAALEQSPDLKAAYNNDPLVREVIDIAKTLEGTNRNTGTHAAGVVISNGPLTDYVPLQRVMRKGEDGTKKGEAVMTTQWVMGDVEKVGLLKMDFLGLRTLTLLDNCVKLIEKTRGEKVDVYKLPLDDRKTYELLQRGDAKGVFQFESDGIRELLKRLRPDNIRDIVACTALYRPGPLQGGMVDAYIDCKHGRQQPVYPHPVMEEILRETYSVMVYQEQIMRVLNQLGGIELSSAYACIKAISKKKQEIIDQRKADFLEGAVERGVSQETAQDIWDKIVVFAGYGFNKCVVGETVIVDAVTGEATTIDSLFRDRRPFTVYALGADETLRPRRVTDVVWNGRKPVYTLQTEGGLTITATDNHPFWTRAGWKNLGDLVAGEQVATAPELVSDTLVPTLCVGTHVGTLCVPALPTPRWRVGRDVERRGRAFPRRAWERGRDEVRPAVVWDRVLSITPAGVEDTYDLTVEEDHNFVADGLIVHNSHSAAYAHVSYYAAYLKAHYTPEFFAALLSSEIEDGNKRDVMVDHIADAKKFGVEVLPPCVNASEPEFSVAGKKVVFGLMAIKGFGRAASEEVLRVRNEGGPFRDVYDFCERIDPRAINRAAVEKLIKAGALDRLGGHRAQLTQALPGAFQAAAEKQRDRRIGQASLFEAAAEEAGVAVAVEVHLPEVEPWPEKDKLKYEKEVLDFYLTSHPLAQYEKELQRHSSHSADQMATIQPDSEVTFGGMLTQIRYFNTQRARNGNSRYLRCKIEDFTGAAECVMWPDDFVRYKDEVREDRVCFARGILERKPGKDPIIVLTQIISVEQMQKEACGEVWLRLKLGEHPPAVIDSIGQILQRYPGTCPVWLCVFDAAGRQTRMRLGRSFGINPLAFCAAEAEDLLGPGSVKLVGSSAGRNGR